MEKQKTTLSGREPERLDDPHAPAGIDPKTGMHKDYWVLTEEERAKGFARPVLTEYVHEKCGTTTFMANLIAETYARNPKFYSSTFCVGCRDHFPVGEFTWKDSDDIVGS